MSKRAQVGAAVAVGVLSMVLSSAARAQDPPKTTGETLKEKASEAVGTIKKGALRAEEVVKNQYAKAKDTVIGLSIEGRVLARLHWEKSLHGTKIELHAPKPGVIVLSGTVADAKARARAVELTTETHGVTEVVDHLTVLSAATKP